MKYLHFSVCFWIGLSLAVSAEDSMEELTTTEFRWVSYNQLVNSHFLPVNPLYTFNRFASFAVDSSLGQLRVRGAEANHLGVTIDNYDFGDPVSEFNFTNLSCVGISSLVLNPNATAGHPAGNLNLSSRRMDSTSWFSQFGSDQTQRHQISTVLNSLHNLTLSHEETRGFDVRGNGDLDGLSVQSAHYYYAGNRQQITARFSSTHQDYDQGRAHSKQTLIGTTGKLAKTTWRLSSSLTDVRWYESWNNNTRGTRTKLSTETPFATFWHLDLDLVFDRNSSSVANQPQNQSFYRTYLRLHYLRPFANWRIGLSKEYIQEQEIDGTRYTVDPTKLNVAYKISKWVFYFDYATRTISFPSMTDRYGWGKAWLPNPHVRPERGTNLDVGVQWSYSWGQLQLTRFSAALKDKISFGQHSSCSPEDRWGCNYSENSTRGRNRGAELSWTHNWHSTVSTRIAWLNLNSEERATQTDPFRRSLRRPENKATLVLAWQQQPWNLELIGTGVSSALDFGNRHLSSYQTIDLLLMRQITKQLTWSFSGFNLLDEQYQQAFGYRTPPRQLNMAIQLTW
ncbi:MAG: TonB-dependent receptor [Gammaproteobacteria bacterium]|nr:TonB-dependent receptor [Gammaproteobacteria bacterium]